MRGDNCERPRDLVLRVWVVGGVGEVDEGEGEGAIITEEAVGGAVSR